MIECVVPLVAMAVAAYAINSLRSAVEQATQASSKAIQSLSMVKGLEPHKAAPDVFGPTNIARADEDAIAERKRKAQVAASIAREAQHIKDAIRYHEQRGNKDQAQMFRQRLNQLEADVA